MAGWWRDGRGMKKCLTDAEVAEALADLPGWTGTKGRLRAEFRFGNFVRAFGFMASVALEAEKANHHPDWSNSYGTVVVELRSHDAGGVTERDLDLARRISAIAATAHAA
jgi:4a-hydroxytetrahydrobiopterin dehydratase